MRYGTILSTGRYIPEIEYSNEAFKERMGKILPDLPGVVDKFAESSGILTRWYAPREWATSDLAVRAAEQAIQRAGICPEEIDNVVENHVPLFQFLPAPPSEAEQAIGGHIADLIEDGATLQLGIGGIPNAITAFLHNRRDLGIHTEMFTDGMVDLYEAGIVTNRRKTLWPGKMVGAFALGTQKLYDFIDNNIGVEFQQGRVTNDPFVIGKNHKMVSVNTALQVDIFGQVCSQSIGYRHFSGTGGQLDTHRGAQLSPGGRGIIALRSTAKDGAISTIVPILSEGAEVTVPSQDVDTIVTEHGVAELRGRSVRDRMEALIKIAHPNFREWLREEAHRLGIVPKLVVPGKP